MLRPALYVLVGIPWLAAVGWGGLALWIDGPSSRTLATILVAAFVLGALAAPLAVRPRRRGWGIALAGFALLLLWWRSIPPSNDRDWLPDVARTPTGELHGDQLTLHNVRNFGYRSETDYTERWETRTYDLTRLRGLDFYLSFWGPTLIAHTIASWEFEDGLPLAISIETRKERGESYSALRGFFREYELYYVVADERDLIKLRTNHRGERVYLYRLRTPPEEARALLLSYVEEFDRLARRPKWYNALTHNCTTTIRFHVRQAGTRNPLNWRIFVNGYADELLYLRGVVDTSLPFAELRARSEITERAKAAGEAADFSRLIREGLPPRPSGS